MTAAPHATLHSPHPAASVAWHAVRLQTHNTHTWRRQAAPRCRHWRCRRRRQLFGRCCGTQPVRIPPGRCGGHTAKTLRVMVKTQYSSLRWCLARAAMWSPTASPLSEDHHKSCRPSRSMLNSYTGSCSQDTLSSGSRAFHGSNSVSFWLFWPVTEHGAAMHGAGVRR